MKSRGGGLLLVISWARHPRKAEELFEILRTTRDDELLTLMLRVGGPGGRIAWAEFGRRNYGQQFGIENGSATPVAVAYPPWSQS